MQDVMHTDKDVMRNTRRVAHRARGQFCMQAHNMHRQVKFGELSQAKEKSLKFVLIMFPHGELIVTMSSNLLGDFCEGQQISLRQKMISIDFTTSLGLSVYCPGGGVTEHALCIPNVNLTWANQHFKRRQGRLFSCEIKRSLEQVKGVLVYAIVGVVLFRAISEIIHRESDLYVLSVFHNNDAVVSAGRAPLHWRACKRWLYWVSPGLLVQSVISGLHFIKFTTLKNSTESTDIDKEKRCWSVPLDIELPRCKDYCNDYHFTVSILKDPHSILVALTIDLNMNHSIHGNLREGLCKPNSHNLLNKYRQELLQRHHDAQLPNEISSRLIQMQDWRLDQCITNFEDCTVTFRCPSLKVSSMHPYIQARRLHECFLIFKLEGFINASSGSSLKASSMLPHIQARRLH
uniref:Uncharacterized protein n=1 Tax=Cucumis melo TaxID=3656 RepID=A0A9I9EKJ8_CUCME